MNSGLPCTNKLDHLYAFTSLVRTTLVFNNPKRLTVIKHSGGQRSNYNEAIKMMQPAAVCHVSDSLFTGSLGFSVCIRSSKAYALGLIDRWRKKKLYCDYFCFWYCNCNVSHKCSLLEIYKNYMIWLGSESNYYVSLHLENMIQRHYCSTTTLH